MSTHAFSFRLSYLCVHICFCHSSSAGAAASLSPAAVPPSGCSLCDLEDSEPRLADQLPPMNCRRTTGWTGWLVCCRCGGGRDLRRHFLVMKASHHQKAVCETNWFSPSIKCYLPCTSCFILGHFLSFLHLDGACVLVRFWAGLQHVLCQAEVVRLHKKGGGWREQPVSPIQPVSAQRQQAGAGCSLLDAFLQLSDLQWWQSWMKLNSSDF